MCVSTRFLISLKKRLETSFFKPLFLRKIEKNFSDPQKILKPTPLDGKKFVDIRVFLQIVKN